jgi:CubicO group peptidase (beta-lactamase class C family)
MPGRPRPLPYRPSLRFLKLEAKRRLAAGEFTALHDAQVAIAWEHGLPTWASLKQLVAGQPPPECHVLPQLRWVITRFREAAEPGWKAPGDQELREHFDDRFLAASPAPELITAITGVAAALREELVVTRQTPLTARVRLAHLDVQASVAADPPHRLTMLLAAPLASGITDPRTAAPPPARNLGEVPAAATGIADQAGPELGLAGLALAGGSPGQPPWVISTGWADLDRGEVLDPGHRWPAYCASALVTATAVLRLIADGHFTLDTLANEQLRTVRLADATITVRELLSHTAGLAEPATASLLTDSVPGLPELTGPVVACPGPRGTVRPSNAGYAVLGQLIADVTGSRYADAVTRLVLAPLGMTASSFPARSADLGPGPVTGYQLTPEGAYVPLPAKVSAIPAIGGLWATPADVVRLGTAWSTLLPAELAREAVTPQTAPGPTGYQVGLGWILTPRGDVAVHAGGAPGATTSLHLRISDNRVHTTLASRLMPLDHIDDRLLRSWTNPRLRANPAR